MDDILARFNLEGLAEHVGREIGSRVEFSNASVSHLAAPLKRSRQTPRKWRAVAMELRGEVES